MRQNRFPLLLLPFALGTVVFAEDLPPSPPQALDPSSDNSPPLVAGSLESLKEEVARLSAEKEKLTAEIAIAQARLEQELAGTKMNTQRLQAELAELRARQELVDFQTKSAQDRELAALKKRLERATLESNLAKAEVETELAEVRKVENTTKREIAELWAKLQLEQQKAESRNYATSEPKYLLEPLDGRRLVMSDRRIPLNGPITMTTADNIVARINYFNNRDPKAPVFIVIDDSPGGSVMAGYKILKAMEGSQAPVHVVVKSFAASMAACIATLAERSYAYPNSVILHHQIQSFSGGNLTQQQEWLKEMEEWWKRLADPVAQKMGISREEFIKQMYSHASSGDWNEFGDNAQKLKWVDYIVDEVEETGTLKHPDALPPSSSGSGRLPSTEDSSVAAARAGGTPEMVEMKDDKGRPYVVLPRVNPLDCYWMYNPDGYFRAP